MILIWYTQLFANYVSYPAIVYTIDSIYYIREKSIKVSCQGKYVFFNKQFEGKI